MGADLILAAFPWPETLDGRPIPPSAKLALAIRDRILALDGQERLWALEDIEVELADEADDLPMDASADEIEAAVAERLPARLSEILDPWFAKTDHVDVLLNGEADDYVANHDRDTVTFRLRGHWYVFSGGMSYGDDPSDSFDTVNFIAGLYDLLVEPFEVSDA